MKYPMTLSYLMLSLLIMMQINVFSSADIQTDKITDIALQMHKIAPSAKTFSSQQMKDARLEFLRNLDEDATMTDLVKAIEMKIDGQDIVTLLRSFENCDVCEEYAKSVEFDYGWGKTGIQFGYGKTLIKDLLKDGWL